MRNWENCRIISGRAERNAAPITEPVREPMPPMMTSERSSAEYMKLKSVGIMAVM